MRTTSASRASASSGSGRSAATAATATSRTGNVGYSGGETRSRVADPDPIDGICLQCYYRDPRHKPLEGPLLKRLRIMAPGDLR